MRLVVWLCVAHGGSLSFPWIWVNTFLLCRKKYNNVVKKKQEVTGRTNRLHLIQHGPHRKRLLQQFLVATGMSLRSCYLATIGGYTDTNLTILLPLRVFVAARTCLPNRCLAKKRRKHFTEPLPSNDRRDTHRLMGGFYEVRRWNGLRCHGIATYQVS
jgi:hypothetical protein